MDSNFRIGLGFDFHPFSEGRDLILGGVQIPHSRGLKGHSDADAVLHAVTDALLGAAGLNDIGNLFPDSDPQYRGASSLKLLEQAYSVVQSQGFKVGNIDVVIIAEEPRILPHSQKMKERIAQSLGILPDAIGIKATTMEGTGAIGRREGIAAQAVALIYSRPR